LDFPNLPDIIILTTTEGIKMTNPFTAVIDWLDENADFGAPIGAFIGVGIAVALCFILGA
jgi:hypothetical protein